MSSGTEYDKESTNGDSSISKEYTEIAFDDSWEFASNSRIKNGVARLYRSKAEKRKDFTVCINAGHGTKGGSAVQTLCHPDGSAKVVSGSTKSGATMATAVSAGTTMKNGDPEPVATLRAAISF